MRLFKIWLRLLNTTIIISYYQLRLLNQRILHRLDEWFNTDKTPVSSKEISASFDEFEDELLDIEEEEETKPYKPYDGPVSMTP